MSGRGQPERDPNGRAEELLAHSVLSGQRLSMGTKMCARPSHLTGLGRGAFVSFSAGALPNKFAERALRACPSPIRDLTTADCAGPTPGAGAECSHERALRT